MPHAVNQVLRFKTPSTDPTLLSDELQTEGSIPLQDQMSKSVSGRLDTVPIDGAYEYHTLAGLQEESGRSVRERLSLSASLDDIFNFPA
jgi:hypothetical protein